MFCKLCGKHLYEKLTFSNIFKLHYNLHYHCMKSINEKEYFVFPVLDKLVYFDYLFEERFEESDAEFLFNQYGNIMYLRMLDNRDWSIALFLDNPLDNETIILVLKLADKVLLIMNIFNENFM